MEKEKRGRGRPKGTIKKKLRCQNCKRMRPRELFYEVECSSTGRASICKICNAENCLVRSYRRTLRNKGTQVLRDMIVEKTRQIYFLRKVLGEREQEAADAA
jgi:hypothetical protein